MPHVNGPSSLYVSPHNLPAFRELGLDAEGIFDHPLILPWRTLPDRENCTFTCKLASGESVFWHIKRYAWASGKTPAEIEMDGIRLLQNAGIPTVEVIAYGKLHDGRSFLILDNISGFTAGDKWIEKGNRVDPYIGAVADLIAKLHRANLHHRDLYFCHFMLRADPLQVRLIDAARVRKLPKWPWRLRWIVKDLAQLWHSLPDAPPRQKILDRYLRQTNWSGWQRKIVFAWLRAKARAIARHDARLVQKQPRRNISLPESNLHPPAG